MSGEDAVVSIKNEKSGVVLNQTLLDVNLENSRLREESRTITGMQLMLVVLEEDGEDKFEVQPSNDPSDERSRVNYRSKKHGKWDAAGKDHPPTCDLNITLGKLDNGTLIEQEYVPVYAEKDLD